MTTALLRLDHTATDVVGATAALSASFGSGVVTADSPRLTWEQSALVDDGATVAQISSSGSGVCLRIADSPELVVISVLDGALDLHLGGRTATLRRGYLGLVPLGGTAHLRWESVRFEAFSIPPTSLRRLLGAPGAPLRLDAPRLVPQSDALGRYVKHAANLLTSKVFAVPDIYERDLARSLAIDALTAATVEAFDLSNRAEEDLDHESLVMRRAVAYMRAHLREPVSMPDVAEAAGVSVRGLQVMFQRRLATTPLLHLRVMRLEAARQSLSEHALAGTTIAEIARGFGYANSGRFATHYRNEFGESPSAALQRIRERRGAASIPAPRQDRSAGAPTE